RPVRVHRARTHRSLPAAADPCAGRRTLLHRTGVAAHRCNRNFGTGGACRAACILPIGSQARARAFGARCHRSRGSDPRAFAVPSPPRGSRRASGPLPQLSPGQAEPAAARDARAGACAETAATRPGSAAKPLRAAGPVNVAEARELSELFYAAKAPERRLILINLDYAPLISSQPL